MTQEYETPIVTHIPKIKPRFVRELALPVEVTEKLADFQCGQKSGSVRVHFKEGQIMQIETIEFEKLPKIDKEAGP